MVGAYVSCSGGPCVIVELENNPCYLVELNWMTEKNSREVGISKSYSSVDVQNEI